MKQNGGFCKPESNCKISCRSHQLLLILNIILYCTFSQHRLVQVDTYGALIIVTLWTGNDGHSGATSAATFSVAVAVAVAAAPLLFFVTSDKRQRRCFFNRKSGSASALFFKQIFCRCRYS